MKVKAIIGIIAIGMSIGFGNWKSSKDNQEKELSPLALENIEALARNEDGQRYSAVKGTQTTNGALKRIKDENGRCVFELIVNASSDGYCY